MKLQCDICGGKLEMQAGGRTAVCQCCGMTYSVERLREKVQEITGTVRVDGPVQARQTGTKEDIAQWKALVYTYYDAGDFLAAEKIVKKILEASPSDTEARQRYRELQSLKYMEVRNGVLVKYSGREADVHVPMCVRAIGTKAFKDCKTVREVTLSDSVTSIGESAFECCENLQKIHIPEGVTSIGKGAFMFCRALTAMKLPDGLRKIEPDTFRYAGLKTITLPKGLVSIGEYAFQGNMLTEISVPDSVTEIGYDAFAGCKKLISVRIAEKFLDPSLFGNMDYDAMGGYECCPWFQKEYPRRREIRERAERRSRGVCQYCGGKFRFFTQRCEHCCREKDY